MTRSVATLQYNASTYNKKARLFTFNSKNRQIRMGIKKIQRGRTSQQQLNQKNQEIKQYEESLYMRKTGYDGSKQKKRPVWDYSNRNEFNGKQKGKRVQRHPYLILPSFMGGVPWTALPHSNYTAPKNSPTPIQHHPHQPLHYQRL